MQKGAVNAPVQTEVSFSREVLLALILVLKGMKDILLPLLRRTGTRAGRCVGTGKETDEYNLKQLKPFPLLNKNDYLYSSLRSVALSVAALP